VRRGLVATLIALIVSVGVLWWLLSDAVIAAFAEALQRAHLTNLILALGLVPVIQGLRACRFALLIWGRAGTAFWPLYGITARLLMLNFLLPFKLGELSFPLMTKRAFGIGFLRSTGVLILARLMDLGVVCAVFALGATVLIEPGARPWSLPVLLLILAGGLALPVFGIDLLSPLARLSARHLRLAAWFDNRLWHEVVVHPRGERCRALALTLAIWLTHALLAWLAASAVADGLHFPQVMLASTAANLAFAVPISGLAGLGPPQAAWATMLHLTGVAWEPAIVTALILQGLLLSGALLLGMLTFVVPSWRPLLQRGLKSSGLAPPI
jgi:glycosyltransferase 2 family protein